MSSTALFTDMTRALRHAALGVFGCLQVSVQTAAVAQSNFIPDPPPPPSLISEFSSFGVNFCYGPPTNSYLSNYISLTPGQTVNTYACVGFYPTSSLCTATVNFTGTDLYTGLPFYGGQYVPGAISSALTPNQIVFAQDPSGPIQDQNVIVPAKVTLTSQPLPPMAPGIPGTYTPSYYLVFTGTLNAPACPFTTAFDGPTNISGFAVTILNVTLIDPIADGLVTSAGIAPDPAPIMSATHIVQGVAADSATQVVVRVTGMQLGDVVQLTLSDENGPSADGAGAGYLTSLPAAADSRTSNGVINIGAVDTGNGSAAAFAIYHAPSDFVRAGNTSDAASKLRNVTIQATYTTTARSIDQASASATQSVNVVRPPVVLLHGLWGAPQDFQGNDGGVAAALANSSFSTSTFYASFNGPLTISSSNPSYNKNYPFDVPGNTLGFLYGATTVLPQIEQLVTLYKQIALLEAQSSTTGAIAAVQVDVVAHSMGGNVTRALPQVMGYADQETYMAGYVHKLITIDTPHLGSPLAAALHDANNDNACVRNKLAFVGLYAFVSVSRGTSGIGGVVSSGATGDLQPTSAAIAATHAGPALIPTAMIAGQASAAQIAAGGTNTVGGILTTLCFVDPLAQLLPAGWTRLMSAPGDVIAGGASDAVVPLQSQFDGDAAYFDANPSNTKYGVVHSNGVVQLGFSPPTALDQAGNVPPQVVNLLNTPVSNTAVFEVKP
jgi:triacylglycerol esterase/lipase EstA (alpha/beta hydrolase family)